MMQKCSYLGAASGTWMVATFVLLAFGSQARLYSHDRPNVLLLCVDDLRPELGCYGKHYIQSPNIDVLASRGRLFRRHYVQAPTCGASRYALLTGRYGPASNQALFQRANAIRTAPNKAPPTLPGWFRQHGYETVSVGKVSHHPGGRGGRDWDDTEIAEMPAAWDRHLMPCGPWQHPRGAMHGLANGEIRKVAGQMDVFQSAVGDDTIYPDGLIANEALKQLERLAGDTESPFLLAVGFIRPHLPFGAPAAYMRHYEDAKLPAIPHPDKPFGKTTWHRSGEFMKYQRWGRDPNSDKEFAAAVRRHYAACVTYSDKLVGTLLDRVNSIGIANNTIVILWGDHGWHLGEHSVWGKHTLFEESLHSPLIISYPGQVQPGKPTDAVVETIDIFPTLCELADLPIPDSVHGVALNQILGNADSAGHEAYSYTRSATTVRSNHYRMIAHNNGDVELYDHRTRAAETNNIANRMPEVVAKLRAKLTIRLQQRDQYTEPRRKE